MRDRSRTPSEGLTPWPFCALATLLLVPALALGPVWAQSPQSRLVAIGDIHGAADQFSALLQRSGLADAENRWVEDHATFVQTGDFMDRGPKVRVVMDLLIQLERDATARGGRVQVLLGNHEIMNLTADVRDATPEIFASFASNESVQRQEAAYREYEDYTEARMASLGHPLPDRQSRADWFQTHPVGFVEYMEAIGPDGGYGQWLRTKPIALVIDDTIFLHGGLSLENDAMSVEELNARAREELERFDTYRRHLVKRDVILPYSTFQETLTAVALELNAWIIQLFPGPPAPDQPGPALSPENREHLEILIELQSVGSWSVIDPNGPVWFRGFARWSPEEGDTALTTVLDRFGVSRAVVGHTVTPTRRITPRFGDRVFLIDTGMLAGAYQGQASALEFDHGQVTAIYVEERLPLAAGAR